jgi:hypothetical protein
MLVIGREQMVALSKAQWRDFASLAVRHVRSRQPEACAGLTDEEIRVRVDEGIGRARAHDFTESEDLIRYLDLLFVFGPDADSDPRVAEILAMSQYTPATRMDLIFQTLAAEEPAAETEDSSYELPDETWPEPEPAPEPPDPVLAPPGESCLSRPPEGFRR